jgi:hypothetical protein
MDSATIAHTEVNMERANPADYFAEAAALFRENESMFVDTRQDREKANLYRGLAALAEGLAQLQQTTREKDRETQNRITTGRHPASIRPRRSCAQNWPKRAPRRFRRGR